jgi:hypothetical protein
MKKIYKSLFGLSIGFLMISSSYAFHVEVLLSNHTNQNVITDGSVTYQDEKGNMLWSQPLEHPIAVTPAHAENVPQDKVARTYSHYSLEYFDVQDENHKVLARCMDDYYETAEGVTFKFDLYGVDGQKGKYYCHQTVKETQF